jgi:predicted dehydrogenase
MKEVRIGIIGQGIISQQHLEEYAKIPSVKIVAVCDIDRSTLDASADAHGVEHRYQDFRELLKRDDLDAVDVCVHNNLHAPIACAVMESGKHCYCEKPMAGAYADAKAMLDASKATGKMLHIQLAQIYSPAARAAMKLIKDDKLGNIYHMRSTGYRRRGRPFVDGYATKEFNQSKMAAAGALYDMGVYHISQLLYLAGNPKLLRVSGQIYQEIAMDEARRQESGFDVEELGVGFAKFEDNLTMDIIESWAIHAPPFQGSVICGSEGGVCLDPFQFFTSMSDLTLTADADMWLDEYRNHQLDPKLAFYDSSQAHWAAALRGDADLMPTADIALNTMLISECIFLSGKLGREVTAEEIIELSKSKALAEQDAPFGKIVYKPYPFI